MPKEFEPKNGFEQPSEQYPSSIETFKDKLTFDSGVNEVKEYYVAVGDAVDIKNILLHRSMWRGHAKVFAEKFPLDPYEGESNASSQSVLFWEEQLREAAFARGGISNIDLELFNKHHAGVEENLVPFRDVIESSSIEIKNSLLKPPNLSLKEKMQIGKQVFITSETASMALLVSSGAAYVKDNPEAAYGLLIAAWTAKDSPRLKKDYQIFKAKISKKKDREK